MKVLPLLAAATLVSSSSLFAATAWINPAGGDWDVLANWSIRVPDGTTGNSHLAEFSALSEEALNVKLDGDLVSAGVSVGWGTDLTFEFKPDSKLTTGGFWRVGYAVGTGSGPASLTLKGPATGSAEVNLTTAGGSNQFYINSGSTLNLTGPNLAVTALGPTILGTTGANHNNTLNLSGGATFHSGGLRVGQTTGGNGNSYGNRVFVEAASVLTIESNPVSLGSNAGHHSNAVTISGTGARMEVEGQDFLIGNNTGDNQGGNYAEISGGGTLETSGKIQIRGYTVGESDHGSNRMTVGNGGTLTSSSTITVGHDTATTFADAVLQLAQGGVINGNASVVVNNGSRFEAAGSGLAASVQTTIHDGGTFAIGAEGDTAPAILTLQSNVDFAQGSVLSLSLFADGTADGVVFTGTGSFTGNILLDLDLTGFAPEAGQSWTLFSGEIANIDATFDLSHLDPLIWNTSDFNGEGGWKLAVIPEPSTVGILLGGLAVLAFPLLRRRRVSFKKGLLPLLLLSPYGLTPALHAETVVVQSEEIAVEEKGEIHLSVQLPEVTAGQDAVLEFTAWYPAPKYAGFYAAMRVFWDHEEMIDILDRPATFQRPKSDKEIPSRRGKWWQVAVLPHPEEASKPTNPYYIPEEDFKMVRYRFRIPPSAQGEHQLSVRNNMAGEVHPKEGYALFPILMLKEIEVHLVAK